MAKRESGPRCVRCRAVTMGRCYWCGDVVCYFHSTPDELNRRTCSPCGVKYYMQWLKELEELKTTTEDFKTWVQGHLFPPGQPETVEKR